MNQYPHDNIYVAILLFLKRPQILLHGRIFDVLIPLGVLDKNAVSEIEGKRPAVVIILLKYQFSMLPL